MKIEESGWIEDMFCGMLITKFVPHAGYLITACDPCAPAYLLELPEQGFQESDVYLSGSPYCYTGHRKVGCHKTNYDKCA